MIINGCELTEEVSRCDLFSLYRGRRNLNGKTVLLKIPNAESENSPAKINFSREFEILENLKFAGSPQVLELQDDCLIFEDSGGKSLREFIEMTRTNLEFFLKIALALADSLSKIHQREITLNSITPDGVLYNPETEGICFIDFSLATQKSTEKQTAGSMLLSNRALLYASPEQTGRMNRTTDYRTDFYSLGAIFYELLTGNPPFLLDDALELIHAHIAKKPVPVYEIKPTIPEMLSEIIEKLLAKTAEQRYQSAAGLKADLEICLKNWTKNHRIEPFVLGEKDVSDKFNLPQKLYGREQEVKRLLSVFETVADGASVLLLVSGYSGIGKTSLIQELYRPIVQKNGYFITGKFDQVARGTPFGALIQAIRGLVRQILTESEERLEYWRKILSESLGTNGGVLAEVVPEIELIIGKQTPPPALDAAETLNRFQLVFQNFVGAAARKEHPLVVFLDDLQWTDTATLSLLQPLLSGSEVQHFLLIGAYRDNEITETHSLTRTLRGLEASGVEINRLLLKSLQLSDLTRLVADSLHCTARDVELLAQLVWEKTGGNPFFVRQFLQTLKNENFMRFDYEQNRWTFQIEDIAKAAMTDNVIDLMTRKIQRLSPKAQNALMLAACIGNPFDEKTLAIVSKQQFDAIAHDLEEAIQAGLITPSIQQHNFAAQTFETIPANASFSFLHDRIQQAAYAMIPEETIQNVHLTVGRLLEDQAEVETFKIVNHLNLARNLITDNDERLKLAQKNLTAGRKAKSSAAFESALEYFKTGSSLLLENHWKTNYELAFYLRLETAECEYLCGNFEEAEQQFEFLREYAETKLDKAKVLNLRMRQYENQARYADVLKTARESLGLFNVSFPESDGEKQTALENEIHLIESLIGARTIESLINLPVMSDAETKTVMNILTNIWASVYITGDAVLARLISAMMVRLSLTHGNTAESAYGYVTHAITVGAVREDFKTAYEFGELALKVNEQFKDLRRRAKIHQQFHAHVALWRKPLKFCIEHAQEACRSGLEAGDFLYAAYGAHTETWAAFLIADDLEKFVAEYSHGLALIRRLKVSSFADAHNLMLHWARCLQGKTDAPLSLSAKDFDEAEYVEKYRDNPFFTMFHAILQMQIFYLFGERKKASEAAQKAGKIVPNLTGMIWTPVFDFWNGLILAENLKSQVKPTSKSMTWELELETFERANSRLKILAENCPENYLCWSLLLAAENERVNNREIAAAEFYEKAMDYAGETNSIQNMALANELFSKFWLGRGRKKMAAAFLFEAFRHYEKFGAAAKVEQLRRNYSELLNEQLNFANQKSLPKTSETLDIFSVTKASQAITGEIELEKLVTKLLEIAIENAGAQRGVLLLERDDEMFVVAEDSMNETKIYPHDSTPLSQAKNLPLRIVNFVRRTLENVVLSNAKTDKKFGSDPYFSRSQTSSIMCVPVVNQGRIRGILYLENNVVSGAFTPERIEICQILASQAAISLENVRLYDEMKQEVAHRREAEETLRSVMEGTAGVTGDNFFASMVRHLADTMQVRYAFVTECRDFLKFGEKAKAKMIAFWQGNYLAENASYELAKTPCLNVFAGQTCYYQHGIQQLFPEDRDLAELNAEGYLGIPLFSAAGQIIGHLAILDDKPLVYSQQDESLLKIFAARAGAELERLHAEEDLRVALTEVEQLKNQLHAENIYLQEEIRQQHNFEEIIGDSPALLETLQKVERVAPTDATVLITGETGTGKELIARAIHNFSSRKNRPLVKVNCGAISAGLVESELFGHAKGAFTGAFDKRIGRFELANGGTIFLDEVGELPLETQVKLLRVLQEGEFEPVGSSKTVKINVRVIAATNRNLDEEIKIGKFRADLFYRLNVFPVHSPPLRERREDIPLLTMFFLQNFAKKLGKQIRSVPAEVMEILKNYEWSGNVRELQNVIERAVVLALPKETTLHIEILPVMQNKTETAEVFNAQAASANTAHKISSTVSALEDVERQHILSVLNQTNWKIEGANGAAQALNLHPNTLRSRLKKLGIKRP